MVRSMKRASVYAFPPLLFAVSNPSMPATPRGRSMTTSTEIRPNLIEILQLDLVGPGPGNAGAGLWGSGQGVSPRRAVQVDEAAAAVG